MVDFLRLLIHALAASFRTQAQLEAEITMLRHLCIPNTPSTSLRDTII